MGFNKFLHLKTQQGLATERHAKCADRPRIDLVLGFAVELQDLALAPGQIFRRLCHFVLCDVPAARRNTKAPGADLVFIFVLGG